MVMDLVMLNLYCDGSKILRVVKIFQLSRHRSVVVLVEHTLNRRGYIRSSFQDLMMCVCDHVILQGIWFKRISVQLDD